MSVPVIYIRMSEEEAAELVPVLEKLALELKIKKGKGHISASAAALELIKEALKTRGIESEEPAPKGKSTRQAKEQVGHK